MPTTDAVSIDWAEYNRVMDDWALVVGRFMVTFATCERWTYDYLLAFGGKAARAKGEGLTLHQRTQQAKKLVKRIGLVDAVQTRVEASFSGLSELAAIRNIVAHNGPMPKLVRDEEGRLAVQFELRRATGNKREITREEIEAATKRAHEIDDELAMLFGEIRQPHNHER